MRHIDTQVAVWLYAGRADRLAPARPHLEGHTLFASPMVHLELQYLHEIGRLRVPATLVLSELYRTMGLEVADEPWPLVVRAALSLGWTRDPFDRLIAAHALVAGAPLITADSHIRTHFPMAVWA